MFLSQMLNKIKKNTAFIFTQFLSLLNENILRSIITILAVYYSKKYTNTDLQSIVLTTMILLYSPTILFSGIFGKIAKKYNKNYLIKQIKKIDFIIYTIVFIGILLKSWYILCLMAFLIGSTGCLFNIIKYSHIPEISDKKNYLYYNSIFMLSNTVSILIALVISYICLKLNMSIYIGSILTIIIARFTYGYSTKLKYTNKIEKDIIINYNFISNTIKNFNLLKRRKYIFFAGFGIAWFWFVYIMFINQLLTLSYRAINNNWLIAISLIGIFLLGSIFGCNICNTVCKRKINTAFIPLSALIITFFTFLIYLSSFNYDMLNVNSVKYFFTNGNNLFVMFCLFIISTFLSIYIIPLYSFVQKYTKNINRTQIFSTIELLSCISLISSVIVFYSLSKIDLIDTFLFMATSNLIVGCYIISILPKQFLLLFAKWIISFLFNVKVNGLDNYEKLGDKRAIIVANHQSFLDVVLITLFVEENLSFAVEVLISKKWWMKPFMKMANTYPIDSRSPMGIKSLINLVKAGKRIMIFPEGRITTTGAMMKIYEGPAMIAEKTGAEILPIRIDGAQYSIFSRLRRRVDRKLFPEITLTILPPKTIEINNNLTAKQKRVEAGNKLYNLMIELFYNSENSNETLVDALFKAKRKFGGRHIILEDINFRPLTYNGMLLKSFVLGNYVAKFTNNQEYVGLLLPNASACIVLFWGLQLRNRIPVMLNFSAGVKNITSACKTTKLRYVFTSKVFVEKAKLEKVIDSLKNNNVKVIFLEDEVGKIGLFDKLRAIVYNFAPYYFYKHLNKNKLDYKNPALILFTSGSEGEPKGVALSHKNMNANRIQLSTSILFEPRDKVFVALPVFHSFGMAATLISMISGSRVFLYPSPLHYKIIPELIYRTNSTIMFGTNTFLERYAKNANPYDFYSLKFVAIGGEKLTETNRQVWMTKFGVRIFEGYGATETAPIISFNSPMKSKEKSVGRMVPGLHCEIEKVENIENGGKLIVYGDNVMLGYILPTTDGKIQYLENGKYDTGDIVEIDEDGYITIIGRVKRFAKIAGEMISMTMVESEVNKVWKDFVNAIITEKDEKKGEKLIIITSKKDANINEIIEFFKKEGLSELSIPREVRFMEDIPLLGTGKINYVELDAILKGNM